MAQRAQEVPGARGGATHIEGVTPRQALADAGYRGEKNFEDPTDLSTDIVVAMGREGKRSPSDE